MYVYLWDKQSVENGGERLGGDYLCVFVCTLSIKLMRADRAHAKLQMPSYGTMDCISDPLSSALSLWLIEVDKSPVAFPQLCAPVLGFGEILNLALCFKTFRKNNNEVLD